jgi:magnesium-transporting ATPase (P-type)
MAATLLTLHSWWRWVVLLVAVITVVKMLFGWLGRREWTRLDDQLSLIFTITIDIEVLLGILVWIMSQAWTRGMAAAFEHPTTMLLALILAHVGQRRARKGADDAARYRTSAIFYTLSFVLILAGVFLVT